MRSDRGYRGQRNQYPPGPAHNRPTAVQSIPAGMTVTVAIIPFKVERFAIHAVYCILTIPFKLHLPQDTYMINDQCTPPEMRIQPSDLEVLLDTLRQHRLVTDFAFPNLNRDSDVPMWADFDLKLQAYLSSIGARFADPSTFLTCDYPLSSHQNSCGEYHNLPWLLLKGNRLRHGRRKITPADPIVFSPKTLCSTVGNLVRAASNQPLLLIGTGLFNVRFPFVYRCALMQIQDADSQRSMLLSRHFRIHGTQISVTVVLQFASTMPSAIQESSLNRIGSHLTL